MSYHFRNLVFEGGGVKGIAYSGALEVLKEKEILPNIKRVGGTSAGAIAALLVGLNYTAEEIKNIISELHFRQFLDDTWGIIRDTRRLISQFGWYRGNFFREWVGNLISAKTGNSEATFHDIQKLKETNNFKDLYFIGTNLSTKFAEVFSHEHTPRMCVADAVRISMSIPFVFTAQRSPRGDCYVDGGVLDNFPIKLFDRRKYVERFSTTPDYYQKHNQQLQEEGKKISPYVYNQETLGFRLVSGSEIAIFRDHAEPPRHDINDFFAYTWSLIETILESQQNQHLHSDDWHRTIYIDTLGVRTMDFGIDSAKKEALVESGRRCTEKYFAWYDNTENPAYNRP